MVRTHAPILPSQRRSCALLYNLCFYLLHRIKITHLFRERIFGTQLVILDPPHILLAAHDPSDLSATSSVIEEPITESSSPELIPRSWWIPNEDKTVYRRLDETLIYLRDFLDGQEVQFDVSYCNPSSSISSLVLPVWTTIRSMAGSMS